MRKIKILTIVLTIVLLTLIAFGGIYIQTQNRMENKVRDYELGRELDSQRIVELKVDTSSEEETTSTDSTEDNTEENSTENIEENTEDIENTEENNKDQIKKYEEVKKTIENRLDNLGATDYTISLNKADGTIRVELPENDLTDMYIYYLTAERKVEIIDKDSEEILLNDDMIKGAKYTYQVSSSGSYQIYEEIELTKDGQTRLNEILNEYALLQTEIDEIDTESDSTTEESTETTESTESIENTTSTTEVEQTESTNTTEETQPTKKIANLTIGETTYEVSKIEKNKITVEIGTATSNTTYINNYMSQAAEIAMIQNSGKMPISYELYSNRYEYSSITKEQIAIFAVVILILILIILISYSIIYKVSGILVSISFIGFLAIYSILIRYTNVQISIEGICGILIILIINLIFNKKLLEKTKKLNLLNEAIKITYKDIFTTTIPIMILTIVTCLTKWDNLSSFGMIMFWGYVLIVIYNILITRTLLKLKKQ